jgi:Tol biopolymer transport system component
MKRIFMKKTLWIAAVLMVLSAGFGALAVQNGHDQFQKALAKERGEGNLEEAIALYQKVIDETKDEALAAKAQLRIGICYEKLGREEARKAFQKVVDNYPSQTETVKTAREKLEFLMKAQSLAAGSERSLKLTKISSGGDPVLSISPDGKKLALLRQTDIWTRDIATGDEVRMTHGGNSNWTAIWSPDGRWIAWGDTRNNIHLISVEKASSRTVLPAPLDLDKSDSVALRGWSQDGENIDFQIPSKGLFSVSRDGGEKKDIFILNEPTEARKYQDMILSPNGRWIAYVATQNGNTDIYTMPVNGGEPVRITSNPAPDRTPVWSFDSQWIGYASYGEEAPQLWALKISPKGTPEDRPVKITNHDLLIGGNWTMDGNLGFATAFRTQHIYIADPDGNNEFQLTQFPRGNYSPRWSPDGKTILFTSDYRRSLNQFRVWRIPAEGGEPSLADNFKDGYDGYYLTPDGSTYVTYEAEVPNKTVVAKIPPGGEEPQELMMLEGYLGDIDWSPDRKWILYNYTIEPEKFANSAEFLRERRSGIRIVPTEGGEPRTLLPADKKGVWYSDCAWSPDGAKIAYIIFDNARYGKEGMYSIWTMNADGSEPNLVTNGGEYNLCWSPDGTYIVYESRIKGMDFEMMRVAAAGGTPEKMNILGRSLTYSQDGKKIAFQRWHGAGYEFWIAENVLPGAKAKAKGGNK